MRWLAIINPHADHHTHAQLDALAQELSRDIGADCVWSSSASQTHQLAHHAKGYDGVIAVGGDGTISEIVNGLDESVSHIGFIPTGTGNGLAGDLALRDERSAIRALAHPHFKSLDLVSVRLHRRGSWQRRFLVSTSALGYVSGITELALGPLSWCKRGRYAVAAFFQAWRQNDFSARLRFDDGPWQQHILTNLVVHNTQYAGQFRLFPAAHLDDGKLDVLLGRTRILGQLLEDLAIITKTFFFVRSSRIQCQKVDVELAKPATFMFDGDLISHVDAIQYQVLPRRLCCCAGEG
jgi:diacylglycerol kinase family enzyme